MYHQGCSSSSSASFGLLSSRLFDHRGRDDDGLRVVFVPALLLGDARIGSHGVAEHGIEINCFEPSGQLGRSDATNDVRDGSSHTKIASESMISY